MRKVFHKLNRQDGVAQPTVLILATVVLVAIGAGIYFAIPSPSSSSKSVLANANLIITATDRAGHTEATTLQCTKSTASASGFSLQPPAVLCASVLHLKAALTAADACPSSTSSSLGPERAEITGTLGGSVSKKGLGAIVFSGGQNVKASFSRANSCEEARFVAVLPILPLATAPTQSAGSKQVLSGYPTPTRNTLLFSLSGHNVVLLLAPPVAPAVLAKLTSGPIKVSCVVGTKTYTDNTTWPASNRLTLSFPSGAVKSCQLVIGKGIYSEATF